MGFLQNILSLLSGGGERKVSEQLLFDKVIGFRGVVDGVGCSTIVQNVAVALSDTTRYKIAVVDTSMLYPCMAEMLKCDTSDIKFDISDYGRGTEMGKVALDSKYSNITVFSFHGRTVLDMVSVTEDLKLFDKLIDELKSFYDVILVDLSQEPTNFATEAAIKCNKIFLVSDLSLRCTANIVNAVNYMATLGVSMSKCKRVILNKDTDVVSGVKSVLSELNMEVFATIPYSKTIYTKGIGGSAIWGMASRESEITTFHIAIEKLLDDIEEKTPKNEKYLSKDSNDEDKLNKKNKKSKELDEHIDLFGAELEEEKSVNSVESGKSEKVINEKVAEMKSGISGESVNNVSVGSKPKSSTIYSTSVGNESKPSTVNNVQNPYENGGIDDEDEIAPTFIENRRG